MNNAWYIIKMECTMIAFIMFPACIVQWPLQRLQAIMICIVIHAIVYCAWCTVQCAVLWSSENCFLYYHCY